MLFVKLAFKTGWQVYKGLHFLVLYFKRKHSVQLILLIEHNPFFTSKYPKIVFFHRIPANPSGSLDVVTTRTSLKVVKELILANVEEAIEKIFSFSCL